jgi:hypothetical protein
MNWDGMNAACLRAFGEDVQYTPNPPLGETVTVRGIWDQGEKVDRGVKGAIASFWVRLSDVTPSKGDQLVRGGRTYRVCADPTDPQYQDGIGGVYLQLRVYATNP